jgi:copper homeostasis protein
MNFEVVIDTIEELEVTNCYNIKRVELCSALELGGLTPNLGLIDEVVNKSKSEVHVMIRPRPGGFIYSDDEIVIMKKDIVSVSNLNCKGVVFGLLNQENDLDLKNIKHLVMYSKDLGLETTFHRAIDLTNNINESIELLIEYGIDRFLTSGGEINVEMGKFNINRIFNAYGEKITIMPAGGVNEYNAKYFIKYGLKDIHFNIKKFVEKSNNNMGQEYTIDEEKIRNITSLK